MSYTSAWKPEEFDRALEQRGYQQILTKAPKAGLDQRILWARAAMASNNSVKMQQACQYLVDSEDTLAIGVYAAITGQVLESQEVLILGPQQPPRTRRDFDGLAWLSLGRSTAYAHLERDGDALTELGKGIAYADLAQMPSRAQLLRQHTRVIEVRLGIAVPEVIHAELDEPMSKGRKLWHGGNYAASLLQQGYYQRAARAATIGNHFHTLALSLQGIDVGELHGPQHQAAKTWLRAWNGSSVPRVTGIGPTLTGRYARLALGVDLSRTITGAKQVSGVIGQAVPRQADQAAIWAAISLTALARGADIPDPLEAQRVLVEAIDRLQYTDDVLALLMRLLPEAVVIGAFGTGAHPELKLAAHQLLRMPGGPNNSQIMAAYAYQNAPAAPSRVPNFGAVLAAVERLADTAADEERSALERHWRAAREELLFDYGSRWSIPGVSPIYHCGPDGEERTLEA